jgi:phosphatidylethanolamine/phosphatidyl-N-methylethanolamine N-methyltransferase
LHLDHVTALRLMDAEFLQFPDDSFDKVVAMYVVSVAPHPARLVSEMRRACRPGGELFIVNHFQHANPVVGGLERLFAPLSRLMGFHTDFSLENFLRDSGLDVAERTPVNALGYWTLLRARNDKTAARIGASRTAVA